MITAVYYTGTVDAPLGRPVTEKRRWTRETILQEEAARSSGSGTEGITKKQVENIFRGLRSSVMRFLHNTGFKRKLYVLLFEPDTPRCRRFEHALLASIGGMGLVVTFESVHAFPPCRAPGIEAP